MSIYVTKSFMSEYEEYEKYFREIWNRRVLTNQGPFVQELENKLKSFLGVENFHYVTNGTIALQRAIRAFDIEDGEIITTPFSYVATTSSILWERCEPVFVDIEPDNFTIDVNKICNARALNILISINFFEQFGNPNQLLKIVEIYYLFLLIFIYQDIICV